ncbi:hypothetical protein TM102_38950 [Bradyrhizobium sp. TM102]|nr:hypothetical protein TM102_38950 [Bradyrhizobium sp. TM102]
MDPDRDHEPVAQGNAVPDHVQMAVGNGVEGTGIEGNARHGPLLPRPARPGKPGRFPSRFRRNIPPAVSAMAGLFRPESDHETKRRGHETISRAGEDVRKLAMVTNPANE